MDFLGTVTEADLKGGANYNPWMSGTTFRSPDGKTSYITNYYDVKLLTAYEKKRRKSGDLAWQLELEILTAHADEGATPAHPVGSKVSLSINQNDIGQEDMGKAVVALTGHSPSSFSHLDPRARSDFGAWLFPSKDATCDGKDVGFLEKHEAEVTSLGLVFKVRVWKGSNKSGETDTSQFWRYAFSAADPSKPGLDLSKWAGFPGYPRGQASSGSKPSPTQIPAATPPAANPVWAPAPTPTQTWAAPTNVNVPGPQANWAMPQTSGVTMPGAQPVVAPPVVAPPPVQAPLADGPFFNEAIGRLYHVVGGKPTHIYRTVGARQATVPADWVQYVEGRHASPYATIDLPF